MNKRERKHMEILRERCDVLRNRIGTDSSLNYVKNWRRELEAMEWIIAQSDAAGGESK